MLCVGQDVMRCAKGIFANPNRERKISPKFFRPKFFRGRPRGTPMPKCLFFQDLEGLTKVFGRMSAGTSGRKLPLWVDFSFLTKGPFRTKNAAALETVAFYYYRSVLLSILTCPIFIKKNSIFGRFAVVNHYERSDFHYVAVVIYYP